MSTTTQGHSALKLWGIAFGIAAGVLAYAVLRGQQGSFGAALPEHFDNVLIGGWLIFSGTSNLFVRAAFPGRFQDAAPDRLRHAVTSASIVLAGSGLLVGHGLGMSLGVLGVVTMILARLRFPKRVFGSPAV